MLYEEFYNADCRPYLVDLSYPSVEIREPNAEYAALLSGAFAGPGSETTALTQYTAHNFYTAAYPVITEAYKCILSVEYLHLNLLGGLIRDLGPQPKFMTYETGQYWSGSFPDYAKELDSLLAADLDGERHAVAHYKRLTEEIGDPQIGALLRRIILDEERHIEILSYFIGRLKG